MDFNQSHGHYKLTYEFKGIRKSSIGMMAETVGDAVLEVLLGMNGGIVSRPIEVRDFEGNLIFNDETWEDVLMEWCDWIPSERLRMLAELQARSEEAK